MYVVFAHMCAMLCVVHVVMHVLPSVELHGGELDDVLSRHPAMDNF